MYVSHCLLGAFAGLFVRLPQCLFSSIMNGERGFAGVCFRNAENLKDNSRMNPPPPCTGKAP